MTRSIQLQLLFILAGTWTLQSVVACPIVKDDVEHNSSDTLYGPKAFEGDIVISPEDFERHYGEPHTLSSESGNVRSYLKLTLYLGLPMFIVHTLKNTGRPVYKASHYTI